MLEIDRGIARGSIASVTEKAVWLIAFVPRKSACPTAGPGANGAVICNPNQSPGSGWRERATTFCPRLTA